MKFYILLIVSILTITSIGFSQSQLDKKTANAAWRKNYSYVEEFINGYALVNDANGNTGLIDSLGKLVLPMKYVSLGNVKNKMLTFTDKNDKYGLLNLKGDTLLACKYTLLYPQQSGKYLFFKENTDSMGMLNIKGEVIFSNIYSYIRPTPNPEYFILCNTNTQFGLFTPAKEILPLEYESINASSEYIVAKKNGKTAILSYDGKIVVPYEYESISLNPDNQSFIGKRDKKSAYLTIEQKELFPYRYESLSFPLENGSFIASNQGKYSIVDKEGTPLFPFEYDYIEQYTGVLTGSKGDTSDVIFPNGKRFEEASGTSFLLKDGKSRIVTVTLKNKKTGIFDYKGNQTYPFEFDYFEFFNNESCIIAKNKKYAISNFANIPKANYKYDYLAGFKIDDNYNALSYCAKKGGKMGIIAQNEQVIIPFDYDSLAVFGYDNGNILARKEGKFGIINENNKVILPCEYDKIQRAFDNFFYAYKNNVKYLLNDKNKIVYANVPEFAYRTAVYKIRNLFYIETPDYKKGVVDAEGNVILPFEYYFDNELNHDAEKDSITITSKEKQYFYFNILQAKIISEPYDYIHSYFNINIVKKNGKFAFKEMSTMKALSGFIYDDVKLGLEFPNSKKKMIICKKDGVYSILDTNLLVLKDNLHYDTLYDSYSTLIGKKGNELDYFDKHLIKFKIPSGYQFVGLAFENIVIFSKQVSTFTNYNNQQFPIYKYGLADKQGKILHQAVFRQIIQHKDGFHLQADNHAGFLRKDATLWLDTIYDVVEVYDWSKYIILQKDKLFGVVTKDGESVFPFEYNKIEYQENMFVLQKKVKIPKKSVEPKRNNRSYYSETKFDKIEKIAIEKEDNYSNAFSNFYEDDDLKEKDYAPRVTVIEVELYGNQYQKEEDKFVEVLKYGVINEEKKEIIPFIYDEIQYSYDKRKNFLTKNNGLMGILDRSGKGSIPAIYKNLEPCYFDCSSYDQRYVAIKDELLGVIDYNNKTIIPFEYSRITADRWKRGYFHVEKDGLRGTILPDGSEDFPIPEVQKKYNVYDGVRHGYMDDKILVVRRRWRWGFVNRDGEALTPIKYSEVGSKYRNGSILVGINDKKGIVNNGIEVLPCEYDQIIDVSADAKKFIVRNGNQIALVNDKNEIIFQKEIPNNANGFNEALEEVKNKTKLDFSKTNNKTEYRAYDITSVKNGLAVVKVVERISNYDYSVNFGIIDKEHKIIIPTDYQYLEIVTPELFIFGKDRKFGVINAQNKVIIPNLYDEIGFANNEFLVTKDRKYGFFNLQGKEIVPNKYTYFANIEDNKKILISEDNSISILDENGKIIITNFKSSRQGDEYYVYLKDTDGKETKFARYPPLYNAPKGYKFELTEQKDLFIIDEKENRKQLLMQNYELQYGSPPTLSEGLIAARKNVENKDALYGFLDINGKWIIESKFKSAKPFKNGFAIVGNWQNYTFINPKGEEITTYDFEGIGNFTQDGIAPVVIDKKVGLINSKGEIVMPFIYYYPDYRQKLEFEDGLLPVRLSKEGRFHVYINSKGEVVFNKVFSQ